MRPARPRLAGTATVAFAGLVLATLATVAAQPAGAAGTTQVRTAVRLCPRATARDRACDAMRKVTRTVATAKAEQLEAEGRAKPAGTKPLGFGPAGGYTPKQLAAAYGIDPNAKTEQTVAIVDAFADPSVRKDLNTFDAHYGIHQETAKSFRVIGQDGGAPPATSDEGWAGEITLDVQSVRSVCRQCKILLIEADSNDDGNLAKAVKEAVKKGATIVSNSYGGPEKPADPQWIRKAYDHKGVAILASSGDDGWYDWDNANFYYQSPDNTSFSMSESPASYPSVVGVGGTSLYLNANGTRAGETAWNEDGPGDLDGAFIVSGTTDYDPGAAGSGCSATYQAPAWQRNVKGYASLGCGSKRSEVDIAALADPWTGFDIYESFDWCTDANPDVCPYTGADDGWATYGGTSLASPLVAGMWGLAGGPKHGVAHPGQTLYQNLAKRASSTYDVTVGGTGGCDTLSPTGCDAYLQEQIYPSPYDPTPNPNVGPAGSLDCAWGATGPAVKTHRAQCYAQPGYDGVSGVGTPRGLRVFR